MPGKKPICLACGVFRNELEALARDGKIDSEFIFLESMLHMKPSRLVQEMSRVLTDGSEDHFLIVYGDCHSCMHEMQSTEHTTRVAGINCCDILLGRELYRTLQKDRAFIFLPEWALRWREVFAVELGFTAPESARAFMQEHRKRLVYLDTGVIPVPEATLREITEFFEMPVEVLKISLEHLVQELNEALQKFSGGDVK